MLHKRNTAICPEMKDQLQLDIVKNKELKMTDTPIPKVTLEQVLRVLHEQNGNLQSTAQYFFELGHSEGEIYMADKINAVETY